jgi:hypothetical protein
MALPAMVGKLAVKYFAYATIFQSQYDVYRGIDQKALSLPHHASLPA